MSKRKNTPANVTPADMFALTHSAIDAIIARLMTQHDAAPTEKHDCTARQWAQFARTLTPAFFEGCDTLAARGIVTHDALRNVFAFNDAPIYGAEKLRDTLRALYSDTVTLSGMSALHYGALRALESDYTDSATQCKTIARIACVSVTGTAPTQRSSSTWALRSLGIVEESKSGRIALSRWADTPAAIALRAIVNAGPDSVAKGNSL